VGILHRTLTATTLPKAKASPQQNQSLSLSQIRAQASSHPSEGRRRDAHRLRRDKHGLVSKRRDTRDLLPTPSHLLSERVPDVRVRPRLDPDRLRLRFCRETRRVRVRLGFDAGALRDRLCRRDDGVRFRVGFRL
jgi:hypothetical protein